MTTQSQHDNSPAICPSSNTENADLHPHNDSTKAMNHPLPSTYAHTIPHLQLPHPPPSTTQSTPPTPTNPRHVRLQSQISTLQSCILTAQTQLTSTLSRLRDALPPSNTATDQPSLTDDETLARAKVLVKNHIRLLHRYNEIKDVAMGLIGLIADKDGRRLGEVMGEFGVEEGD